MPPNCLPLSVLVTGANRGIGLAFVKHLIASEDPPKFLFAACRDPENAKELMAIRDAVGLHIVQLDIGSDESIDNCRKSVEKILKDSQTEAGLNLLINNAAIYLPLGLPNLTRQALVQSMDIVAASPLLVTQAALNMATKCMGIDLANEGILTVAFCPGWVQTAMGGPSATLTPDETVTAMIKTMRNLGSENQGCFLNREGTPHPW